MSSCLSLSSSSYNMNMKDQQFPNKLEKQQGIVSILSSDFDFANNNNHHSLRRTISADMSSQKWVDESKESPLKRVKSTEELQGLGGEEEVKEMKEGLGLGLGGGGGGGAFEDIWSSILTQKKPEDGAGSGSDPAPYVHPLVRRASSLSEKSLEICTESLGSETGSDGFSSLVSEEVETRNDGGVIGHFEEVKVYDEPVKYNNYPAPNNKKVSVGVLPRSFPPPLPSLAQSDDGSNLHLRTHRQDGRLVMEAVSVPSKNCLRALRQGGRLLLTLTDNVDYEEEKEELAVEDSENNAEEEKKVKENDVGFERGETLALPRTTFRPEVGRPFSAATMSKLMELVSSRNMSTWPRMSNMTFIKSLENEEVVVEDDKKKGWVKVEPVPAPAPAPARLKASALSRHSLLPPRPNKSSTTTPVTKTDVLNAYEYYWRRGDSAAATAVAVLKPLAGKQGSTGAGTGTVSPQVENEGTKGMKLFLLGNNGKRVVVPPQEQVLLFGGGDEIGEKAENLVPLFRGCKTKDRRKPLFFFEPYCVATS